MPNQLSIAGANPGKQTKRTALWTARWSDGLFTNSGALRDVSSRIEEHYYGAHNGRLIEPSENVEITSKLTLKRRYGNSVWNSNTWTDLNSFYEFRQFNANEEQIKVMVDTQGALYDASNNQQLNIWSKVPTSGQSYMQSVGNTLFWGDGYDRKKWLTTLLDRIPYKVSPFPEPQNPYNFTPYNLNSFIIDTNGDTEQLIGTVLQLSSFYILNDTIVFSLLSTKNGHALPSAYEILVPGLQIFFPADSQVSQTLGEPNGVTLSIGSLVGGIEAASVTFGGSGYTIGDIVAVNQTSPLGSMNGTLKVLNVGAAVGTGYSTATVPTTTKGGGSGATLNIAAPTGYLVSATVGAGGTGYVNGDYIIPTQADASGGYFKVVSTGGGGSVVTVAVATNAATSLGIQTAGEGYYNATGIPVSGGTGTGLTVSIVDDETQFNAPFTYGGGPVATVTVTTPGSNYNIGDVIVPLESTQTTSGGAQFTVTNVTGAASGAGLTYGGAAVAGYALGAASVWQTSGYGTSAAMTITGVSGGVITSATTAYGGSGYSSGDLLYISQGPVRGATLIVSTTGGGGAVALVTVLNGGPTAYTPATGVATYTSGGGNGATIDITTVSSGQITAGVLNAGGTGYTIGDLLYVVQTGTAGDAYFTVTSVTATGAGGITGLSILTPGHGYIQESGVVTTAQTGTGTGAILTLGVGAASFFPPFALSDTPTVFSGGNPISDARTNAHITWAGVGQETIDGSALWVNRGVSIDGGPVYNWGMAGGTNAPSVVVNNAIGGWVADTYYSRWDFIIVTVSGSNYLMQVEGSGKSGAAAPTWNTVVGQKTTDGTVTWMCIANDGDTSFTWAATHTYTPGHVIEATVSSLSCVFRLQSYSGIMTQGVIPAYCWQLGSQFGTDVGAAGEINVGGTNAPMAQNGGQSLATATYTGNMSGLFLTSGSGTVGTPAVSGNGSVAGSSPQLFPATSDLNIGMFPQLVIPAAGTYTFTIGHQVAMFWGIGSGSLSLNVTSVQVRGGTLTIVADRDLTTLLTPAVSLTFNGLLSSTWLNGTTVAVSTVTGNTFTANLAHANYGPITDTGTATTGATLSPTPVSGPMTWKTGSPNTYNFSTGTPVKGYPIMSANYPSSGGTVVEDSVQISFPSAGVYPAEIHYGVWYHTTSGYTAPVTSPTLPGTPFSFYMVYTPPGSTTKYNILPESLACSSAGAPAFPAWPTSVVNIQAISPAYPSVVEASGNFTWWNLGPTSQHGWTANTNYTTQEFVVDQNSNQEAAYEPGISGTAIPLFSTTLNGVTADTITTGSTGLLWVNTGPEGSTPTGTLATTQGGWSYAVALVNTLDDTVSNASPISAYTGNFFASTGVYVSGGLPSVIDPQADYVAIFRTQDGGATYYLIPGPISGNGNTEYTLPLSVYESQGFTDTTLDSGLNTLLQAPLSKQNSVPPKGIINLAFHVSRIFGSVGNVVYWSTGPDTPVGNGYNGFAPNNFAEAPSLVTKIVPLNAGTLIFTVSDIYILSGDGTPGNPFILEPYLQRIGLLSYNALTVNGSIVYFMTTDNQIVELNVHTGVSGIGTPIADLISANMSPSKSYLTWHTSGYQDQCLFAADGSTGWYRMLPTVPPEQGMPWCPKANIIGGVGAVQSVETLPGNIQLLMGPPPAISGPILFRDYTTYQDNGANYPANITFGPIVLAHPGQLASIEFITVDSHKFTGAVPLTLAVLLGELYGTFEPLTEYDYDPPQLGPSESVNNQRFYLSQSNDSVECRYFQLQVIWPPQNFADEVESLSPVGGYSQES